MTTSMKPACATEASSGGTLEWLLAAAASAWRICRLPFEGLRRWRDADAALAQLETLGERELFDIGMTRVDVHRVARGASTRDEGSDAKLSDHRAACTASRADATLSSDPRTRHLECYRLRSVQTQFTSAHTQFAPSRRTAQPSFEGSKHGRNQHCE